MIKKVFPLIVALLIPLSIGFVASKLAPQSPALYASFTLPPFSPPAFIFGPVWMVLYILMGFASYLIYLNKDDVNVKHCALNFYFIQLIFNFGWTYIFFTLGWQLMAFFWLVVLLSLLLLCLYYFYLISRAAALLLFPTFFWCLFAAYLNLGIYVLNT